MIISVESTVGDDSAIESSNSFTALASALIEVQSWNDRIDVVEQEFIDKANNLDATYPTRLVSVEQQLAEKAKQEEVETISGQINTLVANAGNTDGNAELLDIRVGWDGIVYPTAGEAVRSMQKFMTAQDEIWEVN